MERIISSIVSNLDIFIFLFRIPIPILCSSSHSNLIVRRLAPSMKAQPKSHPPTLHPHADQVPVYDPHDFLPRPPSSYPYHGHTLYTYPQDVDQSYYVHKPGYSYSHPSHRQLPLSLPYPTTPSYPVSRGAFTYTPNPRTKTTDTNASSYGTRQPPPPPASAPPRTASHRDRK